LGFAVRRALLLTKKDSIERSAPRMLEWKQDVTARSLDAIGRWTSPVELRERGLCGLLLVRLGWLQTLRWGGFDGELGLTAPKGG
jgi:hypothetical protein